VKPAQQDIYIYRGDYFELFFRIRTKVWDAGLGLWVPGPYRVLTGWTGAAQVRATPDAVGIIATLAVTFSDQLVTPGGGWVTCEDTVTKLLPAGGAVPPGWDCQLIDTLGKPRTYMRGSVIIDSDFTRLS
jgi:hypothetical protein